MPSPVGVRSRGAARRRSGGLNAGPVGVPRTACPGHGDGVAPRFAGRFARRACRPTRSRRPSPGPMASPSKSGPAFVFSRHQFELLPAPPAPSVRKLRYWLSTERLRVGVLDSAHRLVSPREAAQAGAKSRMAMILEPYLLLLPVKAGGGATRTIAALI